MTPQPLSYPVLLLPVKLETRFVQVLLAESKGNQTTIQDELWIRVFPDQPFLNQFNPSLSAGELKDRASFDGSVDSWQLLVSKYGQYRAAWLVHSMNEPSSTNENQDLARFFLDHLPDQFVASLYWKNEENSHIRKVAFRPIDKTKSLNLIDDSNNWTNDFFVAMKKGMAARIGLTGDLNGVKRFDKILIVGLRSEQEVPTSEQAEKLFRNQRYTSGFSFVDNNTPTNNLRNATSSGDGYDEFDSKESFEYTVNGYKDLIPEKISSQTSRILNTMVGDEVPFETRSYAQELAHALGTDYNKFQYCHNANGVQSRLTRLIQQATWFAMGGQTLKLILGDNITSNGYQELWSFYAQYVSAKGPYPTIKIGDLPYGVLPVTSPWRMINGKKVTNELDPIASSITRLFEVWLEIAVSDRPKDVQNMDRYVPKLWDAFDRELELYRILSMEPRSSDYGLQLVELERTPASRSNDFSTPQSLQAYPPHLIEALQLGTLPQAENRADLYGIFQNIVDHAGYLEYAPNRSFKHIAALDSSTLANQSENKIKLTYGGDWYDDRGENRESLLSFLQFLNKRPNEYFKWFDQPVSILLDLLMRSYQEASKLYNRDIYFTPGLGQIKDVAYYEVKEIGKAVNDTVEAGEVVMIIDVGGKENIAIKAPFEGVIQQIYIEEIDNGGQLDKTYERFDRDWEKQNNKVWDRKLFRIYNQKETNEIRKKVKSLSAQIIIALQEMAKSGQNVLEEQVAALQECFDLNSYRLDAWMTAVAAKQVDDLRRSEGGKEGFYFGAYGWVENLKKSPTIMKFRELTTPEVLFERDDASFDDMGLFTSNDLPDPNATGGIIHCPSPAQAVTAGMFRQSFSTYRPEKDQFGTTTSGSPYTLNLTSDRIQKSNFFLQGVRQGNEMEALLGYSLERLLHNHQKDILIAPLRQKFPLVFNKWQLGGDNGSEIKGIPEMSVINGLAFLGSDDDFNQLMEQVFPPPQGRKEGEQERKERRKRQTEAVDVIEKGKNVLANILDGSADLLFFEAGHQMTQGNFSQASAAMDAAKGKIQPPILDSINTNVSGTSLEHKLVLLFNPPSAPLRRPGNNPKAFIEPTLEQWIKDWIGPMDHIYTKVITGLKIDGQEVILDGEQVVTLANLNIGYLDLLSVSFSSLDDKLGELEQRIISWWRSNTELPEDLNFKFVEDFREEENGKIHITKALELLKSFRLLLSESSALKSKDLASNVEQNIVGQEVPQISHFDGYIDDQLEALESCIVQLESEATSMEILSKYSIQNAASALQENDEETILRSRAEARKVATQARLLMEELKQQLSKEASAEESVDNWSFSTKVNRLQDICRKLFGESFFLIPPCILTPDFRAAARKDQTQLVGRDGQSLPLDEQSSITGGQERIRHWIEGLAEVDTQTEVFSDFLMMTELWVNPTNNPSNNLSDFQFHIAQYTKNRAFPWAALSKKEISRLTNLPENEIQYPEDIQSIVIFKDANNTLQQNLQYGLLIDHFPEFIPDQKVDTGVALQYDAPNNEAPQALLLAVSSNEELSEWNTEELNSIVEHALNLAKVRMVDMTALTQLGNDTPMTYWFNIPNSL